MVHSFPTRRSSDLDVSSVEGFKPFPFTILGWSVDDIAFWDNRNTQHYAVADYLPERRTMHRATVNGDKPF